MSFGTKGCMYNCGDSCNGECIDDFDKVINEEIQSVKDIKYGLVDRYIGLILDERSDDYTIGYSETSDLKKIKDWQQKMLGCTDIVDCKILKVEEII